MIVVTGAGVVRSGIIGKWGIIGVDNGMEKVVWLIVDRVSISAGFCSNVDGDGDAGIETTFWYQLLVVLLIIHKIEL